MQALILYMTIFLSDLTITVIAGVARKYFLIEQLHYYINKAHDICL